jgi:hypothetical protein
MRVVLKNGWATPWRVETGDDKGWQQLYADLAEHLGKPIKFRDVDDLPRKHVRSWTDEKANIPGDRWKVAPE